MPQVSIVIATLNRVHYLETAIRSALSQTFTNFELLVCDDGSLEETRQLCASFGDRRIRHIVNGSPLGIAMNNYSGVMAAQSDLIAFLNDDDRWTPEFLRKCAGHLLHDESAVLAFSDHWLIDAEGGRLERKTDDNTRTYGRDLLPAGNVKDPIALLALNSIPLAMASVFRKSAIDWKLYTPNVEGAYDYFLSYCLLKSGGSVVYVPERLTEWRIHDENATLLHSVRNRVGAAYVDGLILENSRFGSVAGIIRSRRVRVELSIARSYLRELKVLLAMKQLTKAAMFGARCIWSRWWVSTQHMNLKESD